MNIISFVETLQLDKSIFHHSTGLNTRHLKHEIYQKNAIYSNSEIAKDFLFAIENYPDEFLFIVNTRDWYNFFAQANYSRDRFPFQYNATTNAAKMQAFITLYLEPTLVLVSKQNGEQNQFEPLVKLLENKSFIPDKVISNWSNQANEKIDFALARIHDNINQTADISYIKNRSFYYFLSHFNSIEMDEKVRLLSFKMDKIYKRNSRSTLAHETLFALSYYQAFEADLNAELQQHRSKVEYKKANSSSSSSFNWKAIVSVLISIVAVIRLVMLIGKLMGTENETPKEEVTVEAATPVLDRYYTSMKPKVDSLNRYLVDYDQSSCVNLHYLNAIKTGDNPFKFLYNSSAYGKIATGITIYNQSEYDVVLFEKAILYDSIKMPQQAIFIGSKQSLELQTLGDISQRVFSFYGGKKLATFHAINELPIVVESSIEEPRFKELAPNAQSLLSTDYYLQSDLYIKNNAGEIALDSKSLVEFTKPN